MRTIKVAARLWCVAMAAVLVLFRLLRGDRAWMNAAAEHIADPAKRLLGSVSYRVSWSVMEGVLIVLALAAAAFLLALGLRLYRKADRRRETVRAAALAVLTVVLTVMAAADWLWGVYYYADGLQEKIGITAETVTRGELESVTRYAAAQLNALAKKVARDEEGHFAVTREEILSQAAQVYDNIAQEFPALAYADRAPKGVHFSTLMSHLRLTGIYFSYTGEANVNMASPACLLGATAAHEMAHQRGIASEKECNFAAVLACTTASSEVYQYSGWLFAYIHLGNALLASDREAWEEIRAGLCDEAMQDLADNNAYWQPFRANGISQGYQQLYDGYLKNYGESDGTASYGLVVELLVVYYRDAAAQWLQRQA